LPEGQVIAAHGSPQAARPGVRGGGDDGLWQPLRQTIETINASARMCDDGPDPRGDGMPQKEKGPGWKPGPPHPSPLPQGGEGM